MMNQFADMNIHVSLAAEEVFRVGPISITNAVIVGIIGVLLTAAVLIWTANRVKNNKRNFFVRLIQWTIEGFYGQAEDIIGDKQTARRIFPIAMTMFFLVAITYWAAIIPGVGSITWDGTVLFRGLPADLNFTFALAIITMIGAQVFAIKKFGIFGNAGRYLRNPLKDPIGAAEGILEFIGEFSRGTALSFRLFGNAFAGEVLLLIVAVLSGYLATVTLPVFMAFELFIGFIQAYVFFILTIIFTSLALQSHSEGPHDHSPTDASYNEPVAG